MGIFAKIKNTDRVKSPVCIFPLSVEYFTGEDGLKASSGNLKMFVQKMGDIVSHFLSGLTKPAVSGAKSVETGIDAADKLKNFI